VYCTTRSTGGERTTRAASKGRWRRVKSGQGRRLWQSSLTRDTQTQAFWGAEAEGRVQRAQEHRQSCCWRIEALYYAFYVQVGRLEEAGNGCQSQHRGLPAVAQSSAIHLQFFLPLIFIFLLLHSSTAIRLLWGSATCSMVAAASRAVSRRCNTRATRTLLVSATSSLTWRTCISP
jgi:hypothetical protein